MEIEFDIKYDESVKQLLKLSVGEFTPYKTMLELLEEKSREFKISDEKKFQMFAGLLSNITIAFTTTAMQLGVELTHKKLVFDTELDTLKEQQRGLKLKNDELDEQRPHKLAGLIKQNELVDAQIQKLKDETALAKSQKDAIDRQVSDNRVIKATATLGDFISSNQNGGLNVPTEMTQMFFDMIHALVKDDIGSLAKPTNYTMTKR